MRFLIDAQLPPALARYLVSAGHEAHHVSELGLEAADDRTIWSRAAALGAVIVTKDEDFVALHALRRGGPPVVWIRIGNTTRDHLLRVISSVLPEIVGALDQGENIIEVGGL